MQKYLNFDLDTNKLKQYYPKKDYTRAYKDIEKFLVSRGFEHRQGSAYISKMSIDIVKNLSKKAKP